MPSSFSHLQQNLILSLDRVEKLWSFSTKNWVTSVYAADIDQDGDMEVLVGGRDGRAYVLSKDGAKIEDQVVGTKAWVNSIVGFSPIPDQYQARMITGTQDGRVYVLDKDGKMLQKSSLFPNEESRSSFLAPSECAWYYSRQAILYLYAYESNPFDIVFASDDRCVYRYDLARGEVRWCFSSSGRIKAICVYDVDGDGHLETVVGTDNHTLVLLSDTGQILARHQMEQSINALCASDLDGDGGVEILVGTRSKKLTVLDSDLCERWSQKLSSRPLTLAVADVDKDGQVEILAACDDYSFFVLDHDGNIIFRQNMTTRFYSLTVLDLYRDNHVEVLAGGDDNAIHALRIQLIPDLDKSIRRIYKDLDRPDAETWRDLVREQRWQLRNILRMNERVLDKTLSLDSAEKARADGDSAGALLTCLKLAQQKFQFLWEKEPVGYFNTLCFASRASDAQREMIVSAPNGGISAFTPAGRLLWSKTSTEEYISDVQSGYLTHGCGEELAFLTSSRRLFVLHGEKQQKISEIPFPEPISCFSLRAPDPQGSVELLLGTEDNDAYLYTDDFQCPAQKFHSPEGVLAIYASDPYKGDSGVPDVPEILINTNTKKLLAYTRDGNYLWEFEARDRVLAFCTCDLDGDGHLEVLVGGEDCNFHVLDYQGHRRWRYVLSHSVQAIDAADIDGDGRLEILVGCADGVLAVFTPVGDLIWRYQARDRIQALRVCDIDLDGSQEIALLTEGRLEVLRVVNQSKFSRLISDCWSDLLQDRDSLTTLLPLCKGLDPFIRSAALLKLAAIYPLAPTTLDLLEEAIHDTFPIVRSVLPEAIMLAYAADPARARKLLDCLFTDKVREVRIEVIEHLEVLARSDWKAVLSYLRRASESRDLSTHRAALRKVSRLTVELTNLDSNAEYVQWEALFQLVLISARYVKSTWIRQEAGRVLADLLNLYPSGILVNLYSLLDSQVQDETLSYYIAYNLAFPDIRQAFTCLLDLCQTFPEENAEAVAALANATCALEAVRHVRWGSDLWLICRELHEMFALATFEDLAEYEFHLKRDQLQRDHLAALAFLYVGERFNTLMRLLKASLRRDNPNEQLSSLLDGIKSIEDLQQLLEKKYGALSDSPQPRMLEYVALKKLLMRWKEMLSAQRAKLRGHADLVAELQSHETHFEETVGVWLSIANRGRGSATNVRVTLLSSEYFEVQSSSFETEAIFAQQETVAEFLIKPLTTLSSITLTFEIFYEDGESDPVSFIVEDHLDFLTWKHAFLPIANPYTTGVPLRESRMCYGREDDLAYLRDNLTRTTTQSVLVLYGQRRSGKTTLLNQLANTSLLAQHIPVMIDLQKLTYRFAVSKLFYRIADAICQALRKNGLQPPPLEREDYKTDATFAFDRFLDEIEPLLQDHRLILLLDEFEVLEEQVQQGLLKPEIFQYLRSVMQHRYYIHFLLAGLHNIESLTRDYWSVFFNIALHYRLPSRMTPVGAEDLITQPVAGCLETGAGSLTYDPLALTKIHQLTSDQPYLIHLICRALVDHCNKQCKNYATVNDVNLVLNDVMKTGGVHFDWLWDQIKEPPRQRLLQVIAEGARDEGRQLSLDDIRDLYHRYGYPYHHDEVSAALKALLAEDVLEMSEGIHQEMPRYRVSVGLFRQWLRQEKNKDLIAV